MSGELKHHIKTENAPSRLDLVPLHQRPPPYPLEPLPEPDPSRKMSLEQFLQLQKRGNGFQKVGSNELLKCIILSEIEKIPEMWKLDRSVRINNARHYPHVAIEVYKRTGVLVTALSVKMAFKMAKDGLRARLRSAIVGRKFGPVETEQYLWKWPLYGYCRFFRQSTVSVEEKFRKEAAKNPACYVINDDVENEDDVEIEEESAMEVQEEQYEDADVILESTSASYYPDYSQQQSMMTSPNTKMLYYGEMSNFQPERPESVPKAPSPKLPTFEVNFREEMSQITYQAARIAREQPESVKLLRKALFDTVLAFDDKPYTNVGDVFRDLADRHQK